ncbi:MAG TPA: hypothetical protein VFC78_07380 [Tepidisphaeraceae bacterium]|nr:hypothetical protein [Tepidisphaeraceae bacterium]
MKRGSRQFDDFSRHEVYDRASVVLELFESSVADHPVVTSDKSLSAEAEKVTDAIYRFYRKAAAKLLPEDVGLSRILRKAKKTDAGEPNIPFAEVKRRMAAHRRTKSHDKT